MKKIVVFNIVITLCYALAQGASEEKTKVYSNLIITDSNLTSQNIEIIKTVVATTKELGFISVRDNVRLQSAVEMLIKDKILGLTATQRQKLVKNAIGEDNYSILEQILMKQLGSSDTSKQESALMSLGYPLFDLGAVENLKPFVFHKNRTTQLIAIESLVYLDVTGADFLLCNVVLSSTLPDYYAVSAIDALYRTNNKDLENMAPALAMTDIGGGAFKSLLPVLKKRSDYNQIMSTVFKKNTFLVPDKEKLTLEEGVKINTEWEILAEIDNNTALFMSDEAIKKKVEMYANSNNDNYKNLSTLSLLILEKSGQNIDYFTNIQKDTKLSAEKKRYLESIVSRIQKGERLK